MLFFVGEALIKGGTTCFSSRIDFSESDLIMIVMTFGQLFGRFSTPGLIGGLASGVTENNRGKFRFLN